MNKKTTAILIFILIFGSVLRLYQLGQTPISLFGDELDVAYHSWSLISTGRDYMGNLLPTYIRSLAEWRAPLLMYFTAPFMALFGVSPFSVRLPVALLGIFSLYLVYLVVKKLFQRESVALLACFILSITPWHLHYSRASFEVVPLLSLTLLGINSYLNRSLGLSLFWFALTFFTYSTAYITTPLILLGLIFIYKLPKEKSTTNNLFFALSLLLFALVLKNTFWGAASNRFQSLSVLSSFEIEEKVILSRTEKWVDDNLFEKIFANKYLFSLEKITQNYLSSFSPAFLFSTADPFFRHSSGRSGLLLTFSFPLFFLGLYWLLTNLHLKESKLLVFLLLVLPLPASLTLDGGNHATRLFLFVLPLVVISSLSVTLLKKWSNLQKVITLLVAIFIFLSLSTYLYQYYYHYRFQSWRYWHFGYDQIFTSLAKIQGQYSKVYLNNTYQPSLLPFLVYTKYHPKNFQQNFQTDSPDSYQSEYFNGYKFADKYYFGSTPTLESLSKLLAEDTVYLVVQGVEVPGDWNWQKEPPEWARVLDTVYSPLGEPLFYLVTGKK